MNGVDVSCHQCQNLIAREFLVTRIGILRGYVCVQQRRISRLHPEMITLECNCHSGCALGHVRVSRKFRLADECRLCKIRLHSPGRLQQGSSTHTHTHKTSRRRQRWHAGNPTHSGAGTSSGSRGRSLSSTIKGGRWSCSYWRGIGARHADLAH